VSATDDDDVEGGYCIEGRFGGLVHGCEVYAMRDAAGRGWRRQDFVAPSDTASLLMLRSVSMRHTMFVFLRPLRTEDQSTCAE